MFKKLKLLALAVMLLLPLSLDGGYIVLQPEFTASAEPYEIFSLLPATTQHHTSKAAVFFDEIKPPYARERQLKRLLKLLYSLGAIQANNATIAETPSSFGAARFKYVLPEEINFQIERITNLLKETNNPFDLIYGGEEVFGIDLLPSEKPAY